MGTLHFGRSGVSCLLPALSLADLVYKPHTSVPLKHK